MGDQDLSNVKLHFSSATSSDSDSEPKSHLSTGFEDDAEDTGALSDSEVGEHEDYYLDVYSFVSKMKAEFEKHREMVPKVPKVDWEAMPKVDWKALQKKSDEVRDAVISGKEKIRARSKEQLDAGKEKIATIQKKTIKRLKKLKPAENHSLKIVFTKSVLTLVLKTIATCSAQWLLPWYYSITCPALVIWRIYTYMQNQWQYFCLDFCYFGNLLITLILWFAPSSPELCALLFSLANGMLFLGAFSFRNSLVFHSVDKMTSTYIHTVPVILSFGIRWFPKETSRFWHSNFPEEHIDSSLFWNVLAPFLVVVLHTILYTILVNVILKPEEHIITSYRYLKGKTTIKKIFGPNPPYGVFVGMNWFLCLVFSGITIITYRNFYAHVVAMAVELAFITWNGAGFYVDIFRMSTIVRQTNNEKED